MYARGSRARIVAAGAIVAVMSESRISRGFTGRRRETGDPARIPPGQYLTRDFPVLSAGPTPRTTLDRWTFTIDGAVDAARAWTWEEFLALPQETPTVDIHCVTKWSKLDTGWRGVSVDTLLDGALLDVTAWPPHQQPRTYVCGPTGFVEAAAELLVEGGHQPRSIKTERFGPTGG